MPDHQLLGGWVRRFLCEHLVRDRGLARNTQASYRDAIRLLLQFLARTLRKGADRLAVRDLSADRLRRFLTEVEEDRGCGASTRNQRLAAIRSLAVFIGRNAPEHVAWCGAIRAVPFRKVAARAVGFLEKDEMDAVLAAPDRRTAQGRRDYAVLLFLYNTGARASEASQVTWADLHLPAAEGGDAGWVRIRGKGNKERRCPLWERTARVIAALSATRPMNGRVFRNRSGQPLTRFGMHALVTRYAARVPVLHGRRIGPHTIRHTTATHLLRSGVDLNTIRAWLGHVSLATTHIYAEVDLEMKAKALENCEVGGSDPPPSRRENPDLMAFLNGL